MSSDYLLIYYFFSNTHSAKKGNGQAKRGSLSLSTKFSKGHSLNSHCPIWFGQWYK